MIRCRSVDRIFFNREVYLRFFYLILRNSRRGGVRVRGSVFISYVFSYRYKVYKLEMGENEIRRGMREYSMETLRLKRFYC